MKKATLTPTPAAESITLYFKEGGSDKVYTANLIVGIYWSVSFAYGRRGSTMTTGFKIQGTEYATAKKTYDKLVREKMAKGYTPGEDGVAYQHTTSEARDTGERCMLLNELEESELERFISDDAWGAQEKMDGRRLMVSATAADYTGINRKGLMVDLSNSIVKSIEKLQDEFTIDGEGVGEMLYAFDILNDGGKDVRGESYFKRHVRLAKLLSKAGPAVKLVALAEGTAQKRALFNQLKADNAEGIVFKRLDAPYTAGRPDSGGNARKFKFYATGSFIVARINQKRSVALKLADGTEMGNVTITPNKAVPAVGDVVEIRYLYCFPGGSLFQPQFLVVRDDIDAAECTAGQIKFKAGDSEEEVA